MSRKATVTGYQDRTVRTYFEIEIDKAESKDDARDQALARLKYEGVAHFQTDYEDIRENGVEIDEIELGVGEFMVTLCIEGIMAEDEDDVRNLIEDNLLSDYIINITNIEEQ